MSGSGFRGTIEDDITSLGGEVLLPQARRYGLEGGEREEWRDGREERGGE